MKFLSQLLELILVAFNKRPKNNVISQPWIIHCLIRTDWGGEPQPVESVWAAGNSHCVQRIIRLQADRQGTPHTEVSMRVYTMLKQKHKYVDLNFVMDPGFGRIIQAVYQGSGGSKIGLNQCSQPRNCFVIQHLFRKPRYRDLEKSGRPILRIWLL
jgi:hypothetical protein